MLSIWRISWRNITQNKKRLLFTLVAMIVGTAFVTSMLISDKTTDNVFDYYEQMYVANADYWVLSDDYTFSEELISPILREPVVTKTLLALDKQAFFDLSEDRSLSQRSVRITGVSDQNSSLLTLPVVEGKLDNEGLVVPEPVANLLGKGVGDTVRFTGMGEAKISAIVEYTQLLASPSNWERAESTSFRIMAPLSLLREWTGNQDGISYMRFQVEEDGAELFNTFQQKFLGTSAYIEPVVADDLQSNDIGGLYTFFYLIAGLSIFISGFIVFNMIYTSVIERKKEFAIMKSLGYTQGSVSKLVFIEMSLLAVIGTGIGVPLGIWLGDLFMKALLGVFEFDMVYTLNWEMPSLLAVLIGLLFPILFALFPIYYAGKTSILLTIKNAAHSSVPLKQQYVQAFFGVGLLVMGMIDHPIAYIAVIVGTILVFPIILKGLTSLVKPVFVPFFKYPGKLAIQNVTQQVNRNGNTAAILAIGIAVILLLSAVVQSAPTGLGKEIRSTYGGDMRVTSETPWSAEDMARILSYDRVTHVEPVKEATPITWETNEGQLKQFSVLSVRENGSSLYTHEQKTDSMNRLRENPSVMLGERAFSEWGGAIGDSIVMNTPNGRQSFEVIGVGKTSHYTGYVAFMDERVMNEVFGWPNSFDLLLNAEKGSYDTIRAQLWTEFGSHLSKVETVEEEIQSTTSAVSGMNELLFIMLFLVVGLASIGTANTLLINTLERVSELGTMRALGFTKQQVRTMILAEGLLIGVAGVVGGIATAIILIFLTSKLSLMEGFLTFGLPYSDMLLAIIAGLLLSLAAAWISSKSAGKMDIQTLLKEG
ncbi:FtsX-like permease family protein [Sporosarcina sp. Te-1]|uniref:FtsX-like permease family protein n=1 Tax=Sporosarcina sp. Te-1 TaxID=2818390 RepID=UPI001A9E5AFF|nr:ABC transporter permease [Sporosarcina sp. Te-1]QTD41874.1 FtsX-like permease family protein [Sporosarcina sp. Te-1]